MDVSSFCEGAPSSLELEGQRQKMEEVVKCGSSLFVLACVA